MEENKFIYNLILMRNKNRKTNKTKKRRIKKQFKDIIYYQIYICVNYRNKKKQD